MNSSVAGAAAANAVIAANHNTGFSGSIMHVASGLFAQGSWIRFERGNQAGVAGGSVDDGTLWQIQGGIAQNWFGIGKTVLYGEYARGSNLQATFSTAVALSAATENDYTMWGVGIVQNIDAAATEIYLAYRRHSLDRDIAGGAGLVGADVTGLHAGQVTAGPGAVEDIHILYGGIRIAF